jgi:hypothetical protein
MLPPRQAKLCRPVLCGSAPNCSQAYAPDFDCRLYSGGLVICALIQSLLNDTSILSDVCYLLPRQQFHLGVLLSFATQTICRCTPRIPLQQLILMAQFCYGEIDQGPSMTAVQSDRPEHRREAKPMCTGRNCSNHLPCCHCKKLSSPCSCCLAHLMKDIPLVSDALAGSAHH